jgi:hypothetical protein
MLKNLKYLIISLIVVGLNFGSNAQGILEAKKANLQTCFKEVRCSKLDSAQHDLQTIPFLKEEIESWKEINTQKDVRISEQAKDIISQAEKIKELEDKVKTVTEDKDHDIGILKQDIKTANEKVKRRGLQRAYALGIGYVMGKIF